MNKTPTALTIAGSDPTAGAGIQADIKAMTANGVYAMSAVTALTAQNTTGVSAIMEATPDFLAKELDCIFTDIFPDAVKIGMVSSAPLIEVIAERLKKYGAKHIVLDPVMVSSSGTALLEAQALTTLCSRLIPLAQLITPNIPEAELLTKKRIRTPDDMERAALEISQKYSVSVLLKGGHSIGRANDFLLTENSGTWIHGKRINNPNTHGTGCTLSSAVAANLAKGYSLHDSVHRAKEYITGALSAMLDLGKGSGPMDHAFDVKSKFMN